MRVPHTVLDGDERSLTVQRAWPHDDGRLTVEAVEEDGGRLRAGVLRPDGSMRIAPFAEDPALPDLPGAAAGGHLLVHRYRKRAVVRRSDAFLKILPASKVADVAERHAAAARLTRAAGIDVPRVIGVDGGTVRLSVIGGRSLHELGRPDAATPSAVVEQGWRSWAARWPLLVRSAAGSSDPLPAHGPAAEVRALDTWVERCHRVDAFPGRGGVLTAAADRARAALTHGTPQKAGLAHRDLHDKQVFLGGGPAGDAVGIIDCDTLALAEPALDLANLLVHLEFREAQGLLDARLRAHGETAVLEAAETLGVPADRLAAYALSTRVRLACVYAFRPRWQGLAREWLEDA